MFIFAPGCIGIGHRLRWTLDSAPLELRMLLVPATISCVLKWGKRFFFCVGGGSYCFVRKYVWVVLCGWAKDHTVIWLQKVAVSNMQFRISRCSALIVLICCKHVRPVRFHTRLNKAGVCSKRTPASIWTHLCLQNCRGRHQQACSRQIPENVLR